MAHLITLMTAKVNAYLLSLALERFHLGQVKLPISLSVVDSMTLNALNAVLNTLLSAVHR